MKKRLKDIILFPLLFLKLKGIKKIGMYGMKERIVKLYKLNVNQTRHLEGNPLWKEILKNKWYRIYIPLYTRWEFYSGPFRVFFELVKNYLKNLYKWSKLELEVYVFHLEEIKKLKKWLKKIWLFYFVLLVGIVYLFLYGLGTIYIIPYFWKFVGLFLTEEFCYILKEAFSLLDVFFYLGLFVYIWETLAYLFGMKSSESEDVTNKMRELDIFEPNNRNYFYKKVDPSVGVSAFHGGLNLSEEEKGAELKNRETENWKLEWLGIQPEYYKVMKLSKKSRYSKYIRCDNVKKGLKLEELYNWDYLRKFLNYGKKLEKETLEEVYMNWERGFEKIKKIPYVTEEVKKRGFLEIKLEPEIEEGDTWDSVSRYCLEMPLEEETDFYAMILEPELNLYPFGETVESDNAGGIYNELNDSESELVDLIPTDLELLIEEEGGVSGLYKDLEHMVFRRQDLICSDKVIKGRWKEGMWNEPASFFSLANLEDPYEKIGRMPYYFELAEKLPLLLPYFSTVYPIHEEFNLKFKEVVPQKGEPLDLAISKTGEKEDELVMLQGMWSEYGREILLIDEIYQRVESKKEKKSLVEMELSYLTSEEMVPWSRVVYSGMESWYEEPYEIYLKDKEESMLEEFFSNDKEWEEEENWETNEETTWLVEEDGLEEETEGLGDYFGIMSSVFCYVWIQSYAAIGYKPVSGHSTFKDKHPLQHNFKRYTSYLINWKKWTVRGRKRKKMVFTREYVQSVRERQRLKDEDDLEFASKYDQESFYYNENYNRIDMLTEMDYGNLIGVSGGFWEQENSWGMEMSSGKEGFYGIVDFSFTFWGTLIRLFQLLFMFLIGLILTAIDWSTGLLLSLGTWYLDYWWPLLATICWSSSRFILEGMMVLGSVLGYIWDLFYWMISGYEEGLLRVRAAYLVRGTWGVESKFTFDDFSFHKILLDYWKSYPFSFGGVEIKPFFWEKIGSFEVPTKWFAMQGKNWDLFINGIDKMLDIFEFVLRVLDSIYVYSWCMAGIVLKTICLVLFYSLKLTGICLHYLLMGLLKLIALIICII